MGNIFDTLDGLNKMIVFGDIYLNNVKKSTVLARLYNSH